MFQRFFRALFGNAASRRTPVLALAVEVLEERVLLAGDTFWTDGAATDNDFKTDANWDPQNAPIAANPVPGVPDTGIFENLVT